MNESEQPASADDSQHELQDSNEAQNIAPELGAAALTEGSTKATDQGNSPTDRVDDYDKALEMAHEAHNVRSHAAYHRTRAEEARIDPSSYEEEDQPDIADRIYEAGKVWDHIADRREEEVGQQYDISKARQENPELDTRIKDSDKAHVMASVGDQTRRKAAYERQSALLTELSTYNLKDEGMTRAAEDRAAATKLDQEADRLEEEAGRQYDAGTLTEPIQREEKNAHIKDLPTTPERPDNGDFESRVASSARELRSDD